MYEFKDKDEFIICDAYSYIPEITGKLTRAGAALIEEFKRNGKDFQGIDVLLPSGEEKYVEIRIIHTSYEDYEKGKRVDDPPFIDYRFWDDNEKEVYSNHDFGHQLIAAKDLAQQLFLKYVFGKAEYVAEYMIQNSMNLVVKKIAGDDCGKLKKIIESDLSKTALKKFLIPNGTRVYLEVTIEGKNGTEDSYTQTYLRRGDTLHEVLEDKTIETSDIYGIDMYIDSGTDCSEVHISGIDLDELKEKVKPALENNIKENFPIAAKSGVPFTVNITITKSDEYFDSDECTFNIIGGKLVGEI